MASPQEIQVTLGNRISDRDATLGSALERVLEAQQDLVIRRANLLIEELAAQTSSFVIGTVIAALGAAIAFVGGSSRSRAWSTHSTTTSRASRSRSRSVRSTSPRGSRSS
jgi:hypothetical protein